MGCHSSVARVRVAVAARRVWIAFMVGESAALSLGGLLSLYPLLEVGLNQRCPLSCGGRGCYKYNSSSYCFTWGFDPLSLVERVSDAMEVEVKTTTRYW